MKRCATLALVTAMLLGCRPLQTLDIRRPLTPRIPSAETLPADPQLIRSMKKTTAAINSFTIKTYDQSTAWIPTEHLAEAITLAPENPFAWVQLGAQLTLDYQPDAAVRATEKALSIIDSRCKENCTRELEALRAVGLVNLAMIHASNDRAPEARIALEAVAVDLLPDVDKLAHYWTSAYVSLQLGEMEDALHQLSRASRDVPEDLKLSVKQRVRRPHYLGNIRRANEHFLRAMVHAESGQPRLAEEEITLAVAASNNSWEARILRANLLMERRDFDGAVRELEELAHARKGMIFHPERIQYNRGNALVARYAASPNGGNIADLRRAVDAFEIANGLVQKRVKRARARADSADVIEKALDVSSIFLDAFVKERPVYADALNNLGDVHLRLASLQPSAKHAAAKHAAAAEHAWLRALSDFEWSRRDLAWSNLTRHYVRERPRLSLETAEEALKEDPYNIASLQALAAYARSADSEVAARLYEGIARSIWARWTRYEAGSFDELLRPGLERLRSSAKSEARDRAILLIELVLAPTENDWKAILSRARTEHPTWSWVHVGADVLGDADSRKSADAAAESLLSKPHVAGDWWQRRELADAHVLRARRAIEKRHYETARRELELAVGHGADPSSISALRDTVDLQLQQNQLPATRAIAVVRFPTTYSEDYQPSWSESLPHAVSSALQQGIASSPSAPAGEAAWRFSVRYLDRETLGAATGEATSPAEAGRRVNAGAVLSGRIATTRKKIIVDLILTDPASGNARELGRIQEDLTRADLLTGAIVDRVVEALRLPHTETGAAAVAKVFTRTPEAYVAFLDGLAKLLGKTTRGAVRPLMAATQKDEQFARAWAWLAEARYRGGKLDEARRATKEALKWNASVPEAWLLRASLATTAGDRLTALANAVKIDPDDATLRRMYAATLREHGQLEDALTESHEALRIAPYSAAAMTDLGLSYYSLGRLDEALQQANDALARRRDFAPAHELMSSVVKSRAR
jgi:tetratricopeptide (TPR) repeat protein